MRDKKKTHDIVLYLLMTYCFNLFWVAKNIKTLLINKKLRVMLCAGSLELGDNDIRWGVYYKDPLSPFDFVLGLILLDLILRKADQNYSSSLYRWSEAV